MRMVKRILAGILLLSLLAAAIAGLVWCGTHFYLVDFRLYPKGLSALDLRDKQITLAHYEKLCQRMPQTRIYWNIPFQGKTYPMDTQSVSCTSLTPEDVLALSYMPMLKTVQADGCKDYEQILQLQKLRPELKIHFGVELDGTAYSSTARQVQLGGLSQQELELLSCFSELEQVQIVSGGSGENLSQLQQLCKEKNVDVSLMLGSQTISSTETAVEIQNADGQTLKLLPMLNNMQSLHLVEPEVSPEELEALVASCPEVEVSWEKELFGVSLSTEDEEIDLSEAEEEIDDLEQVRQVMAYFPQAEQVFLGKVDIENEEMAAFREEMRDQYKVVWTVMCGPYLPTRTDATSFMPGREGIPRFLSEDTYNLRYCEDMIAIDVGHQGVDNIEYVAYMPHLKYLILAHTNVRDISPIRNCKELVFLELDWSPVRDLTPLQECTALEDLNIGQTGVDVSPLYEMPWLKNVWCVFRSEAAARIAAELPDTKVVSSGNATVSSGWRDLPNYYDMRDALNMYYMKW